jgi:predicted small metal-binding protein
MKTMSCKQMGGPCDIQFHGNSADEVIKALDQHLKEMVNEKGDEAHKPALQEMQGRWKNPIAGMKSYMDTKKAFATLQDDQ